ncbi:MAG: Rieske (2Fe-2S) protein [Myxococcota bacterium]
MKYLLLILSDESLTTGVVSEHPFRHGGQRHHLLTYRLEGQIFCWVNRCPHWQIPLGLLDGMSLPSSDAVLTCGTHRARFHPQTGECLVGPCLGESLLRVPVTQALGHVFFYLPREWRNQ